MADVIPGSTRLCMPDWGQRFRVRRELARVKSAFQDIVIFESGSHGRVMLLDGVVQITEADEFVYQEMIAHVPLLAHGACTRVLIIGAGDGGVLRRVLQHRGVARAVMVEIDGEVIRLSRELLPAIGGERLGRSPRRGNRRRRHRLCPARGGWLVRRDHRRQHRSDRRRRSAVHRRILRECCARAFRRGRDRQPVRRAVHAGRRTAADECPACKVLLACWSLCRCRPDLCRRVHDPRLCRQTAGTGQSADCRGAWSG